MCVVCFYCERKEHCARVICVYVGRVALEPSCIKIESRVCVFFWFYVHTYVESRDFSELRNSKQTGQDDEKGGLDAVAALPKSSMLRKGKKITNK